MLYHGTSKAVAQKALREGLRPRGGRTSNWSKAPSRNDRVYLTDTYAVYFAFCAAGENANVAAVLEIDESHLDAAALRPDEDFLAHVLVARGEITSDTIAAVAASIDVEPNAHLWPESRAMLGNVAYKGTVPAEAISRIAYVTLDPELWLMVMDPTVSIMHHKLMGDQYRSINRWIFDGEIPNLDMMPEEQIRAFIAENGRDAEFYRKQLVGMEQRRQWFKDERPRLVTVENVDLTTAPRLEM